MKAEHVALCRAVTNPKMRQSDVPTEGSMDTPWWSEVRKEHRPGFLHTDTGLIFGSRSALKKAIRICWNLPNPMRRKNEDRLYRAVVRVVAANDMSVPKMVNNVLEKAMQKIDFDAIIRDEVRAQVGNALRGTGNRNAAGIVGFIKEVAVAEAKRLILENLTLDMTVSGSAHTLGNRSRAMRLED